MTIDVLDIRNLTLTEQVGFSVDSLYSNVTCLYTGNHAVSSAYVTVKSVYRVLLGVQAHLCTSCLHMIINYLALLNTCCFPSSAQTDPCFHAIGLPLHLSSSESCIVFLVLFLNAQD